MPKFLQVVSNPLPQDRIKKPRIDRKRSHMDIKRPIMDIKRSHMVINSPLMDLKSPYITDLNNSLIYQKRSHMDLKQPLMDFIKVSYGPQKASYRPD